MKEGQGHDGVARDIEEGGKQSRQGAHKGKGQDPGTQIENQMMVLTRFLDGIPPMEPRRTVTVVPILAPMTMAIECSRVSRPPLSPVRMMAMLAELDCIRAVIRMPMSRKTQSP